MNPQLVALTPAQRLRRPIAALVLGIVPTWVFVGTSETRSVDGEVVAHSRLNYLGVVLGTLALLMAAEALWKDGPWSGRWMPRTLLALAAAVVGLLQVMYSLGVIGDG